MGTAMKGPRTTSQARRKHNPLEKEFDSASDPLLALLGEKSLKEQPECSKLYQRIKSVIKPDQIDAWLNEPVDYLEQHTPGELLKKHRLGVINHYLDVLSGKIP